MTVGAFVGDATETVTLSDGVRMSVPALSGVSMSVLAGGGEDPEAAEAREIVQEALGGNPWPRGDEGEGDEE